MSFDEHFKTYIKWLSILGIALHQPNSKNSFYAKIPLFIYTVTTVLVPTYCIVELIMNDILFERFGPMELLILNVAAIGDAIRGVLQIIHIFIYKSHFMKIWTTYRNLESYFHLKLGHRLTYQLVCKQSSKQMAVVLGGYLTLMVSYILKNTATHSVAELSIVKRILQWSSACSTVYVLFYINILSYYLLELNVVIQRDIMNKNNDYYMFNKLFIVDKLKNYKVVHFHLWLVSQWLNLIFGWHLLLIVLNACSDCIYSATWLEREMSSNHGVFAKLRKRFSSFNFNRIS